MVITQHLRSASGRAARATRVDVLARWHIRSHEVARRNAMIATTALTQRRFEREEVEEFLLRHRRSYDARAANAARTG
jgi:hypothetical protein